MIDRKRAGTARSKTRWSTASIVLTTAQFALAFLILSDFALGLVYLGTLGRVFVIALQFALIVAGLTHEFRIERAFRARVRKAKRCVCPYCLHEVGTAFNGVCPECGANYTKVEMRRYWESALGTSVMPKQPASSK